MGEAAAARATMAYGGYGTFPTLVSRTAPPEASVGDTVRAGRSRGVAGGCRSIDDAAYGRGGGGTARGACRGGESG